jgi:myosin-18
MENQRLEQQVKKGAETREEEHDRHVNQLNKKIKLLEEQLDREYEEKSAAQRAKRDAEYQLAEAKEQALRRDPEAEKRLRKALRKSKALLHDTQEMLQLEQTKNSAGGRTNVRALRNELDDVRDQLEQALRAKRKFEEELEDRQQSLMDMTRDRETVTNLSL